MGPTFALFAALTLSLGADDPGWQLLSEKDGVQVYRRSHPDSAIKSIKGSGVVDAPVATIASILVDCARAPEWVDSLAENKVIRVIHPKEYIEYNHASMPFIVSDRDFVTRVSMEVQADQKRVTIRSAPATDPLAPERKGIVRGAMSALYVLDAIDDGKRTRLTVEIHADPKGALPAWVVNFFQKDWSHDTIAGIRKQARKSDLQRPAAFTGFLAEADFTAAAAAP
jgi:hypothetical protein